LAVNQTTLRVVRLALLALVRQRLAVLGLLDVVAAAVDQPNPLTARLVALVVFPLAAAAAVVLPARVSWLALVALVVRDIARSTHGKLWRD